VLPGWAWVDMIDRDVGRAGDTVIVLGYRAESSRDGAEPYRCFCGLMQLPSIVAG
jgi:hypothetical protein